jgi:hypothetical protein
MKRLLICVTLAFGIFFVVLAVSSDAAAHWHITVGHHRNCHRCHQIQIENDGIAPG